MSTTRSSKSRSASVIPHVAEDVLPGHPDRLADSIAERFVKDAVIRDPNALVGVEVAVFRSTVLLTGRIAAGEENISDTLFSHSKIDQAFQEAGYVGRWALTEDGFAGPGADPDTRSNLRVLSELELGGLTPEEAAIRGFSDDQSIVVGHASGSEGTGWLPPAVFAARRLRNALQTARSGHPGLLGPDGKVLVRLLEKNGRYKLALLNVSVQHAPEADYELLHRCVVPTLEQAVKDMRKALPWIASSWSPDLVRLNGGGDFSCGGTYGDNGLSGKKLVVDHYGPGVPIGGGALCGKDAHKVDRAGALRARQIAVRIVRDTEAREATVRLGFLPGQCTPAFLEAQVDGTWLDGDAVAKLVPLPDLSLEKTFEELALGKARWHVVARKGYFGWDWSWER